MYQRVEDRCMEIVEFDTMPELPIRGLTEMEQRYENILNAARVRNNTPTVIRTDGTYAAALTDAIETGVITEPGKYGIEMTWTNGIRGYAVHKIIEE